MNCTDIAEKIESLATGELPAEQRDACMVHIKDCRDCADALRGSMAMQTLRRQELEPAPEGFFERIVENVTTIEPKRRTSNRFWQGAAVGGALAASLLAAALMLGVLIRPVATAPQAAEFFVSSSEARIMNIAIDADRALPGAKITILLSGNVEVDGYGSRRELSWSDDLEMGVNKLSLPLLASGIGGGQMVVRLSHPDSEQMFVINLPVDG